MNTHLARTRPAGAMQTRSGLKIHRQCPVDLGVWGFPNKQRVASFEKRALTSIACYGMYGSYKGLAWF